ncbi:polysaccharide pyruvyl transferase CsaB [Fervidobacterium changbaicum]|uniref:Polysaccharide pyruvyl transferase family protein n=2 Tax=Fervidobacterium TaxID=2422 RepID=A0AAI8CLM6_FERIS|nr:MULTISPECIES: polysaccharide pyruvyl transferase family protein [Fervidobacterium]AMW32780.1 polysaccharide pyruvyl transferase family protein [Fervidobacterium islandicum]QAV32816.1 polysaccharide pyruvyl transferase [Fervidobacterium changbaicum]SDG94389.1 polysaccharide pyruvyl transferase CsaB [Fervidobacterium changbaicum]
MKVLLSGYYGYGNFGDELMRLGMEDFFSKFKIDYTLALPKRVSKDTISRFNLLEVIGALFDSEALIYGGGGLLQDITSSRSFLYYISTVRLSLNLGKPVILFGNSLGPVRKGFNRWLLRTTLKNEKVYVFARDIVSYRYAKCLNKNAELSCDPAVRYLAKFQVLPDKQFDLVLVPRKVQNVEKYDILKHYFNNIIVCPAQSSDIDVAMKISRRLGAECIEQIDDINIVLSTILSAKFVVSERFHPTLVAAYFGIPFVSLENSKSERFFRKYTNRREFFAKDTVDFPKRFEQVISNPLFLKEKMDTECDDSFKKLYKLLIRIKSSTT